METKIREATPEESVYALNLLVHELRDEATEAEVIGYVNGARLEWRRDVANMPVVDVVEAWAEGYREQAARANDAPWLCEQLDAAELAKHRGADRLAKAVAGVRI